MRSGGLSGIFVARCVGWQPPGRWEVATSSTIWLTPVSHVPHHCPMRRSSESQGTRRVLLAACGDFLFFCISSCFSPSLSSLSVPPQNRDGNQGGARFWDVCYQKMMQERCFGESNHGVHFTWSELCRPYSLYAAALLQNQCIQFCFCFLHRTFLQHDSWGEDRRRQQISLRRKCKTCMSVFSSYWACFFWGGFYTSDLITLLKKNSR